MLDEKLALIIVSGYGGYSSSEVMKAQSFRTYLMNNGYPAYNIRLLTKQHQIGSYAEPTVDALMDNFEWLRIRASSVSEITIYISGHVQVIGGNGSFRFNDGNISTEMIDGWIGNIPCSSMTIVLTGVRSGLAGADLAETGRSIYCSMNSNQDFDPDLFNLTRGLKDPGADLNRDGMISFNEAFDKEVITLSTIGQEPVRFIGGVRL
jgi:hypothetical protein